MVVLAVQPPTQYVQHIAGAPDNSVVATIDQVAMSVGVPTALAEAMARLESGFNPTAVGDHGTSFGLYQLHQGGMLGNLTPQQAFDPATNARVSLTNLGNVLRAHPGIDAGQAAAMSQRPAAPNTYAAEIDAILRGSGVASSTPTTASPFAGSADATTADIRIPGTPWHVPTPNDVLGGAADAATGAIGDALKAVLSWIAKPLEAVALIGLGLVVIVIGLVVLAHQADGSGGGGGQRTTVVDRGAGDAEEAAEAG